MFAFLQEILYTPSVAALTTSLIVLAAELGGSSVHRVSVYLEHGSSSGVVRPSIDIFASSWVRDQDLRAIRMDLRPSQNCERRTSKIYREREVPEIPHVQATGTLPAKLNSHDARF